VDHAGGGEHDPSSDRSVADMEHTLVLAMESHCQAERWPERSLLALCDEVAVVPERNITSADTTAKRSTTGKSGRHPQRQARHCHEPWLAGA